MPPWLAVGYAAIDFVGNIDFIRENIGELWPGSTAFSLIVFVGGIAWLGYVSNKSSDRSSVPASIGVKRVGFARLGKRTYEGVEWPVSIMNGEISVGNPFCPMHNKELEHKPSYVFKPPNLASLIPSAVPEIIAEPSPATSLFDALSTGLVPPPTPEEEERRREFEERMKREDEEKNEREELGIEPLTHSHSSGDDYGPYCFKCRKVWPLPKTVGQCMFDVRSQVEAELREEAEAFCD